MHTDRHHSPGPILAGCVLLLTLCAALPPARAGGLDPLSPWPMFHRDLRHSSRSDNPIPAAPVLAWSRGLSDSVEYSSPVMAADGTIYIGDQGKELWAFQAWGMPKWNFHTGGNLRYSTPAVGADSTVYIGSADGKLYAIRHDGTLKWASPTGGAVKTSPAIAPDGTIYVGSDDGKLWAFYPSGAVRWTFTAGDTIRSSPTIGADGTVFFGSYNGNIYAVWPTGTQRWTGATGGPIKGSAALTAGGSVIVGSSDGFLYSITPDGVLNWASYTGENLRTSPAVGASGTIYIGMDLQIAAFHDSDGSPAWDFDTGGRVYSTPCVYTAADQTETVLCGSDDGRLYAVSYGAALWSVPFFSPVRSSPAISADAHVLIATLGGALHSIGSVYAAGVGPGLASLPLRLVLGPNPMPFDESLRITLSGIQRPAGRAEVFDLSGRLVRAVPFDGAGAARWDGSGPDGLPAPAGVYFVRAGKGGASVGARVVRVR